MKRSTGTDTVLSCRIKGRICLCLVVLQFLQDKDDEKKRDKFCVSTADDKNVYHKVYGILFFRPPKSNNLYPLLLTNNLKKETSLLLSNLTALGHILIVIIQWQTPKPISSGLLASPYSGACESLQPLDLCIRNTAPPPLQLLVLRAMNYTLGHML